MAGIGLFLDYMRRVGKSGAARRPEYSIFYYNRTESAFQTVFGRIFHFLVRAVIIKKCGVKRGFTALPATSLPLDRIVYAATLPDRDHRERPTPC